MKRFTNRILISSFGILILTTGISYFLYNSYAVRNRSCGTKSPEAFCGTISLTEEERLGKQLFNANCAACHKLNKKMTGPALAKIDSTLFWNWMTRDNKIDTSKIGEMGIDYHKYSWGKTLDSTQLNRLHKYMNRDF